jgi:hypothetical protein
MFTYKHPVIGVILIASGVEAVAWAIDGNGNRTFIDANARHPNLTSVCIYDTVNYGVLCQKTTMNDAIDIDGGISYGQIVAQHINRFLARHRASIELGLQN